MRPIDQLAALQAIDSQLDAERHRYAEIQAALQEPESLRQARETRSQAQVQWEHWQRERKLRETAVSDQQARIKAQEDQLYKGKGKDPREQVALQKNVESLKRHLRGLEDEVLEAMVEGERWQGKLAQAEASLEAADAAWQQTQAGLQSERQALVGRARQTKAQRDTAAAQLDTALLQRYEGLRQKRSGVAVAHLQGGNCGGCGGAIPTAVRQQAHGDALIACPLCGRLLCG